MYNFKSKFTHFFAVYFLVLAFFMQCSDGLSESSAGNAGLGPVKILLTDIELPASTGSDSKYHSLCNGDKEHDKDCSEYLRMTKAIIIVTPV